MNPSPILDGILQRLQKVKPANGQWMACCPAHEDSTPSLSLKDTADGKAVLLKCHAGCTTDAICKAIGITPKDLFIHDDRGNGQDKRLVSTYSYRDATGKEIYQVLRYDPKAFRQRRPDGAGGWIWSIKEVKRLPYKLPEVLASQGDVYVVEGEKDVETAWRIGLVATCNSGGAGKWQEEFVYMLGLDHRGSRVVVIPDRDENQSGMRHAVDVARSVVKAGSRCAIVELPEKDLTRYIEAGGTAEDVKRLAAGTTDWTPPPAAPPRREVPIPADDGMPRLSETGNAVRFAKKFGSIARYCAAWDKWIIWNGSRWKAAEGGEEIELAKSIVVDLYAEAGQALERDAREAIAAWAKSSDRLRTLTNSVTLAQAIRGIPIAPAALDVDPFLLNVANGTVNLQTGDLRPYEKSDMLTKQSPVAYDPGAKAPRWIQFLDEIMGRNAALVAYLQRVVGYTLTASTREQVLFFLHGGGANGKSTFLRVLAELLGRDYSCNAPSELLLARPNGAAPHPAEKAYLFGKRLVCASEAGEGHRMAEALIKQLTGEDLITARRMYENFWEFTPTHKIFFAANHKPIVHGTDIAIWRRIRLIPFNMTFSGAGQDRNLFEKLKAEMPGILAWAIAGCLAWKEGGLQDPKEVLMATEGYRFEMDMINDFIETRCDVGDGFWATANEMYNQYCSWCDQNGEEPIKQRTFGLKLRDKGYLPAKGTAGIRIWKSVGIKTQYALNSGASNFGLEPGSNG